MQDVNMIRNIAILGHGNCGKTSLAEAMLFTSGKIKRLGKVDDGNSAMDYEEEEINRNISISSSFHNYTWKKHDVYLIDTPGDDNFLNETLFASQITDGAIFNIGAVLGVRGQTIKFAEFVAGRKLPSIIAVNKMDRERADFNKTISEIKASLPLNPVVLQLPIGAEDDFRGFIDVVTGKGYQFAEDGSGKVTEIDVPEELADEAASMRENLMENVAETDDDLIEKFLEEGELPEEDLLVGLKNGVLTGDICPVCVVAATLNKGTGPLLDMINNLLPSPGDMPNVVGTVPGKEDIVEEKADGRLIVRHVLLILNIHHVPADPGLQDLLELRRIGIEAVLPRSHHPGNAESVHLFRRIHDRKVHQADLLPVPVQDMPEFRPLDRVRADQGPLKGVVQRSLEVKNPVFAGIAAGRKGGPRRWRERRDGGAQYSGHSTCSKK